jgi:hypothetical protein
LIQERMKVINAMTVEAKGGDNWHDKIREAIANFEKEAEVEKYADLLQKPI